MGCQLISVKKVLTNTEQLYQNVWQSVLQKNLKPEKSKGRHFDQFGQFKPSHKASRDKEEKHNLCVKYSVVNIACNICFV